MASQQQPISLENDSLYSETRHPGASNRLHILTHGIAFALTTTCVIRTARTLSVDCNLDGSVCGTNELIYLYGVALSTVIFACLFAAYARSSWSHTVAREQSFATLWKHSLIMSVVVWFGALWFSASIEDIAPIMFFTFNTPFILMVPYAYAAYCHPTSPFGSWLHKAREAIQRRDEIQRSGRVALRGSETQPLTAFAHAGTGGSPSPREEHWKQSSLASPSSPP